MEGAWRAHGGRIGGAWGPHSRTRLGRTDGALGTHTPGLRLILIPLLAHDALGEGGGGTGANDAGWSGDRACNTAASGRSEIHERQHLSTDCIAQQQAQGERRMQEQLQAQDRERDRAPPSKRAVHPSPAPRPQPFFPSATAVDHSRVVPCIMRRACQPPVASSNQRTRNTLQVNDGPTCIQTAPESPLQLLSNIVPPADGRCVTTINPGGGGLPSRQPSVADLRRRSVGSSVRSIADRCDRPTAVGLCSPKQPQLSTVLNLIKLMISWLSHGAFCCPGT